MAHPAAWVKRVHSRVAWCTPARAGARRSAMTAYSCGRADDKVCSSAALLRAKLRWSGLSSVGLLPGLEALLALVPLHVDLEPRAQ
jgi:hypothetical protein